MALFANPYFLLLFTAQAVFVIRWIYRSQRERDITTKFVNDVASNHLPHIYDTEMTIISGLNKLLEIYGLEQIKPTLPPPIQFVDFEKKKDGK